MQARSRWRARASQTMAVLRPTERLPANFGAFIDEIAPGMAALYGEKAGRHYRRTARRAVRAMLAHPDLEALAVCDGADALGLLFALHRGGTGQLSFLHVLRPHGSQGLEDDLVREAVARLRARHVAGILWECIPFCPLRLDGTFLSLGFEKVERLLMSAPLDKPLPALADTDESEPYDASSWEAVAETIVAAYDGRPGRRLHVEVRDLSHARAFVESVAGGAYGAVRSDYGRAIWRGGRCAGVVVGCEVAPKTGFVLQLAVRPEYQNEGIGRELLGAVAGAFRGAGLARMMLGVTRSNPAKRLYARLGFDPARSVNAYCWWDVLEGELHATGVGRPCRGDGETESIL